MGNRAVITSEENFYQGKGTGIYLHWNGGRDSVVGFLTYCMLRGFRPPEKDDYGWARLAQVIGNFMGADGLSVGVGDLTRLDMDNYDNGTYLIRDWEIVGRRYFKDRSEQNTYPLITFLESLDECQPEQQRLGKEMIHDLLEHGRSISAVTWDYNYEMKKRKESQIVPEGFTVGKTYGKNDLTVKISGRKGKFLTVETENGETKDLPLFRWSDGCETILIGEGYNERQIDSTQEVKA